MTFYSETLKPRLQQARVLVVGDVMLDRYWFGDVSRISPEAPVPVAKIEKPNTARAEQPMWRATWPHWAGRPYCCPSSVTTKRATA